MEMEDLGFQGLQIPGLPPPPPGQPVLAKGQQIDRPEHGQTAAGLFSTDSRLAVTCVRQQVFSVGFGAPSVENDLTIQRLQVENRRQYSTYFGRAIIAPRQSPTSIGSFSTCKALFSTL